RSASLCGHCLPRSVPLSRWDMLSSLSRPLPSPLLCSFFFCNDPATPEIYTLSLHDALPTCPNCAARSVSPPPRSRLALFGSKVRSEEHTSELQSLTNLVCRLLLEKKKNTAPHTPHRQHQKTPHPLSRCTTPPLRTARRHLRH